MKKGIHQQAGIPIFKKKSRLVYEPAFFNSSRV